MATAYMPRPIERVTYSPETRAALAADDARRDWQFRQEEAQAIAYAHRIREQIEAKKTPLQRAGDRLDTAASVLRYLSSDCETVEEAAFGAAELELEQARGEYLRLLCEASGEGQSDLVRRAAA